MHEAASAQGSTASVRPAPYGDRAEPFQASPSFTAPEDLAAAPDCNNLAESAASVLTANREALTSSNAASVRPSSQVSRPVSIPPVQAPPQPPVSAANGVNGRAAQLAALEGRGISSPVKSPVKFGRQLPGMMPSANGQPESISRHAERFAPTAAETHDAASSRGLANGQAASEPPRSTPVGLDKQHTGTAATSRFTIPPEQAINQSAVSRLAPASNAGAAAQTGSPPAAAAPDSPARVGFSPPQPGSPAFSNRGAAVIGAPLAANQESPRKVGMDQPGNHTLGNKDAADDGASSSEESAMRIKARRFSDDAPLERHAESQPQPPQHHRSPTRLQQQRDSAPAEPSSQPQMSQAAGTSEGASSNGASHGDSTLPQQQQQQKVEVSLPKGSVSATAASLQDSIKAGAQAPSVSPSPPPPKRRISKLNIAAIFTAPQAIPEKKVRMWYTMSLLSTEEGKADVAEALGLISASFVF